MKNNILYWSAIAVLVGINFILMTYIFLVEVFRLN